MAHFAVDPEKAQYREMKEMPQALHPLDPVNKQSETIHTSITSPLLLLTSTALFLQGSAEPPSQRSVTWQEVTPIDMECIVCPYSTANPPPPTHTTPPPPTPAAWWITCCNKMHPLPQSTPQRLQHEASTSCCMLSITSRPQQICWPGCFQYASTEPKPAVKAANQSLQ